jgi:POLO box duplicated region
LHCRPTLDEVEAHPFLADNNAPTSLPTSALSIIPIWRVNEYGELVCTDKTADYSLNKKPAIPRSASTFGRRPFASHDPNTNKAASTTTPMPRKNDINMERVVKNAVAAMSGAALHSDIAGKQRGQSRSAVATSTSVSPAFEIFDEFQSTQKPAPVSIRDELTSRDELDSVLRARGGSSRQIPPQRTLTEEALCLQTKTLSLDAPSPRLNSGAASSVLTHATESVFSGTENDAEIFKLIVDHLGAVLTIIETRKGTYRTVPLRPTSSRRGPTTWVVRYVDYTCKYGLGFLLNDGCSGVYFNDSTKTALEPHGDTFQYIERKRNEDVDNPRRRGETTVETHTLETYPDSLKKKVTLLKHFRNYLLQQQVYDGIEEYPAESSIQKRDVISTSDLVYVKKWVRTKHAILFSLSNRTIQVIFYDQTEILLTPDIDFLTYVDKHRKRFTYAFTDELVGASAEIEKRLRYAKDIMLQLVASGNKN